MAEAGWGTVVQLMDNVLTGEVFRVISPIVSIVSFGAFLVACRVRVGSQQAVEKI
jgi:hypothetical protein